MLFVKLYLIGLLAGLFASGKAVEWVATIVFSDTYVYVLERYWFTTKPWTCPVCMTWWLYVVLITLICFAI